MPFWTGYRMGTISFPIQAHRCPVSTPISFPFSQAAGSGNSTREYRIHSPQQSVHGTSRTSRRCKSYSDSPPGGQPVAIGHDLRWRAAWVAVTLTEPLEEPLRSRLPPLRDTGWPLRLHLHNVTENRPPAIAISHQNASRPLRSATRPALTSAGVPRRCAPRWRPPSSGPQAPPAACRA